MKTFIHQIAFIIVITITLQCIHSLPHLKPLTQQISVMTLLSPNNNKVINVFPILIYNSYNYSNKHSRFTINLNRTSTYIINPYSTITNTFSPPSPVEHYHIYFVKTYQQFLSLNHVFPKRTFDNRTPIILITPYFLFNSVIDIHSYYMIISLPNDNFIYLNNLISTQLSKVSLFNTNIIIDYQIIKTKDYYLTFMMLLCLAFTLISAVMILIYQCLFARKTKNKELYFIYQILSSLLLLCFLQNAYCLFLYFIEETLVYFNYMHELFCIFFRASVSIFDYTVVFILLLLFNEMRRGLMILYFRLPPRELQEHYSFIFNGGFGISLCFFVFGDLISIATKNKTALPVLIMSIIEGVLFITDIILIFILSKRYITFFITELQNQQHSSTFALTSKYRKYLRILLLNLLFDLFRLIQLVLNWFADKRYYDTYYAEWNFGLSSVGCICIVIVLCVEYFPTIKYSSNYFFGFKDLEVMKKKMNTFYGIKISKAKLLSLKTPGKIKYGSVYDLGCMIYNKSYVLLVCNPSFERKGRTNGEGGNDISARGEKLSIASTVMVGLIENKEYFE